MKPEDFRAANVSRCNRWHPDGIESWSLSDWAVALAGECGEMTQAALFYGERDSERNRKALANELADVFTYADIMLARLGRAPLSAFPPGGGRYWPSVSDRPNRELLMRRAAAVSILSGRACECVKKLNRIRDGLVGNSREGYALSGELDHSLLTLPVALDNLAQAARIDLITAVCAKFNEVSERNGFPERL